MSELGQALKDARENKGLTLDALQEQTKIQKRYLQAIEEGHFERLPGAFYTRAFIKSYAETVGLDFAELTEKYASEMPKVHHESSEIRTLPPDGTDDLPSRASRPGRKKPGNWSSVINKAIIIVICLIVLMIVYILISNFAGSRAEKAPDTNQGTGSSISFSGTTQSDSGSSIADSGNSQSGSSPSTSQKQSLKPEQTQENKSTYTLTGTTEFKVNIATKNGNPAWFRAKDETGKILLEGTASDAGKKSYSFDAGKVKSLSIKFGSVPNTEFRVNGQAFHFPNKNIIQTIIIKFNK
ncbi:helix-turn-helix domain-containing protein [Sporolactobacillus sp. Y61]|uniref:Helix-turn-helix domain-containing protein n=1 Tax=Sporolactobacillus sp. Y61 TaxID=3160863 RepID=A0AAU8ICJ5_9BACL